MDENHPSYRLQAPGASGSSTAWRLPERDFPRVDDHLDEPEVTRWERIGGRRIEASPAERPHATQQVRLDSVVDAKVAPGYEAASDLKTRFDEESDFASDTAILKEGIDPETGTRYLEEVAFEIVSEQGPGVVTGKAQRMMRRGVKRVFAIFVKKGEVAEWSPSEKRWVTLHPSSSIVDKRLVEPLPVKALVDAVEAKRAVASGLVARGNPLIRELRAESQAEGRAEGMAQSILSVLEARGLCPSPVLRDRILSTKDPELLDRWISRAALVSSAEELLDEK